jgi:hypothetical protein
MIMCYYKWCLDLLTTQEVVTTNRYNTIANLNTLQIATAYVRSFQCAVSSPVTPW